MEKTFLPIILGTDANAYGLARSFNDKYNIKSLAIGSFGLRETKDSNIIDVLTFPNLNDEETLIKTLINIYSSQLILVNTHTYFQQISVLFQKFPTMTVESYQYRLYHGEPYTLATLTTSPVCGA